MEYDIAAYITRHSAVLTVIANYGMFLVWVIYLQLFLVGFLRQRRASILISRGAGRGVDARCLVGNMGAEPIYVQSIVARMAIRGREIFVTLTDRAPGEEDTTEDITRATRQGPLLPGHYMEVDRFRRIFYRLDAERGMLRMDEPPDESSDSMLLEVLVLAFNGSDDVPVGATRQFRIAPQEGRWHLSPLRLETRQIRSLRHRRRLAAKWREILLD